MAEWEFVALMSITTAAIAISVDTLLPAFGEMREVFGMAPDDNRITWTITSLFLGLGLGQFFWGPLADRFGRKSTLYWGLGVVIVASIGTTMASSFGVLIAGRVVLGFGAASVRAVTLAITRDSYSGDQMARITALITAVFLVVPVLGPLLGEVLVRTISWRATHAAGGVLAVVVAFWLRRLDETLADEHRRPLQVRSIGGAVSEALRTPVFLYLSVAAIFTYASFFPWLGSSEKMIGLIYDRPGQFALLFAVNAAFISVCVWTTSRLVDRIGSVKILLWVFIGQLVVGVCGWVLAVRADGVPSFWLFFVVASLLVTLSTISSPLMAAISMEPVGHIAGTAASLSGFLSLAVGAALAAVIDARIQDTITPFFAGFAVLGAAALVLFLIVRRRVTALVG